MSKSPLLLAALAVACTAAAAQTSAPAGFPEDSAPPAAAELRERLGGKVFNVKLADGASWRLEYKSNGYFFINTSRGFNDSGEWKVEDGRLCNKGRRIGETCHDVRVKGSELYMKRDNGEIVQFVPQS
ncbi:hypothetical protein [Caldimonas tepidiphila]|uniref:hypothetical protein n=1 Tax=Caldimonas tepidiphila TaxID=2315841 RepID=UPI001300BDDD|nr:hypothetical protein [Caldimonas tepidiphila]